MKRLGIIFLFVTLFVSFIVVWNISYRTGKEEAYIPIENTHPITLIPSETGVFERSKYALDYANMPIDENHQRTLETYYENRAFHGAPPSIPHPVANERSMGEDVCLKCHQNGGFVEKFDAYAPVTPHPEMVNCRQCHVAQVSTGLFRNTNFEKLKAPVVGVNNAMLGSPPIVPHQIQMHENCLSCHAGPSAPEEIRVTHPERINCRQCHVINNKEMTDIGIFKRGGDYVQ
ncbi:nitrate reductase cytochrome c-type subunit [Flavobacteriaceae bacterium XHP0103]|uniref:cytochrome C n=1 Tax=Marixanthotalea marina TaxID=2844359 RepID=UPI00298A05C2|nr:cytochrome C [Marixanthotalea marina]MBU3821645.1 nitrate reductase cytochrome c-type subunit [Marixanthotalea marina]